MPNGQFSLTEEESDPENVLPSSPKTEVTVLAKKRWRGMRIKVNCLRNETSALQLIVLSFIRLWRRVVNTTAGVAWRTAHFQGLLSPLALACKCCARMRVGQESRLRDRAGWEGGF